MPKDNRDIDFILNAWSHVIEKEGYSLYLHAPFCGDRCKYCVYTGKLISDRSYRDLYNAYVNTYLPEAIGAYRGIFTKRAPDHFYFGGGTPNLIRPEDMQKIFDCIPNFEKIPHKIIDLHPAYLSDRQVDFLIASGFTTVCTGVQSFDSNTLKRNRRTNPPLERLRSIIRRFNDAGVYTSIDLMCFITDYRKSDLDILIEDLRTAMDLDLSFIDINPNLHFVLQERSYAAMFESAVDDFLRGNKKYLSEKQLLGEPELNNRYIYRIVKRDLADIWQSDVLPYYADDFPYARNNIIGIGDLDNGHSTMSYIHKYLFYVERNIGGHPTYDFKYVRENAPFLN